LSPPAPDGNCSTSRSAKTGIAFRTGARFCFNFGRIAAGLGTVFFGLFSKVGDYRLALFYAGFLFIPAAAFAWLLPEPPDEQSAALAPNGRSES